MRARRSLWCSFWHFAKRWLVTLLAIAGIVMSFLIGFLDCTMDIRQSWIGSVCKIVLIPYFLCIEQLYQGDSFAGSWQTWPEILVFALALAINAYVLIRPDPSCDRWRGRRDPAT